MFQKRTINRRYVYFAMLSLLGASALFYAWWLPQGPPRTFPRSESDYYVSDEIVGHRHKPEATRDFPWSEHKTGRIVMKTNNLGFRKDENTYPAKAHGTVRILVTGDSHMDGVVYNSESFPNTLESLLNAAHSTPRFEVLNGGTGYYGPENYRSFLQKYAYLKPDVFVVVLYSGNDFIDVVKPIEARLANPLQRPGNYRALLREASDQNSGAVAQAFNQIFYFKTFPHMKDEVLVLTKSLLTEIRFSCRVQNIPFVLILLPTKLEIEWDNDKERLERTRKILGLSEADLSLNDELRRQLGNWILQQGISFWDATEAMRTEKTSFFWNRDYHLNTDGHHFLAHGFYERFNSLLNNSAE